MTPVGSPYRVGVLEAVFALAVEQVRDQDAYDQGELANGSRIAKCANARYRL